MKLAIGTGKPGVPFASLAAPAAATGCADGLSRIDDANSAPGPRASVEGAGCSAAAGFGTRSGKAFDGFAFNTAVTGLLFAPRGFEVLVLAAAGERLAAARDFAANGFLPFAFGRMALGAAAFRAAFFGGLRFAAMTGTP